MTRTQTLPMLASLCLLLSAGSTQSDEGYIADNNGCKIANPNPKPLETVTWSGGCKDGFAEGTGTMQWFLDKQQGAVYEGSLVHGALSGKGKLTLPDGATYEGEWRDGRQNGKGKLTTAAGETYTGEWKDGRPDGRGELHNVLGETITGLWKDGTYQGKGEGAPARTEQPPGQVEKPAEEK